MTFKINPYYRLFMNAVFQHCLICFLHAFFADESLSVYVCMLYIGVLIFGQHEIRRHIHNTAAYLLLHILLIVPCALFYNFSILDLVIVGLFAVTLTGLSFRKSIYEKNGITESEDTISPFTILILPLFSIAGSYYELPLFTKFVFFEAVLFMILFICHTFNVNENRYIHDHCPTADIPVARILTTTANIKSIFIITVAVVMFLIMGINIAIPELSHNHGSSTVNPATDESTQYKYNNNYPDLSKLHTDAKAPSELVIFLSYIFIGVLIFAGIVLLFTFLLSVLRTLHGSINPQNSKSTLPAEDDITVEALPLRFFVKRHTFSRAVTNSDRIRRLFKNATKKKMRQNKKLLSCSVLNSKTPTEINQMLSPASSSAAVAAVTAYPDEVISIYQEARYSNHDISADAVKKMNKQLHKKD